MELDQAIRRRHMVRDLSDEPVPRAVVDRILRHALHAPSAGFTQGVAFVVLEGAEQTGSFWRAVWAPELEPYRRRWPGLQRAPVIILPLTSERAYLERYAEEDKARTGLSVPERWPMPYWLVDAAFASMLILLSAVDQGLGGSFFAIARGEARLLEELGVPGDLRPIGAIALGYPRSHDTSRSVLRGRRPLEELVHRGRW
ncbi:MAG: nitroreductase family protein [Acidimicrobiales bacterium]|nr:nitroreductase family protein [Acidimicrobiales bacterium]MBO0885748.1 nitroreductase family protein [Acidimicrobiales bacterium]MBO0894623.1 nitroreductase family protein [Acidimicrobiales bacterium]